MTEPVLLPDVTVVVHPYLSGWRWAVMVGGRGPADLDYCAGAGHCQTEPLASVEGECSGSTAAKALRMLGVPVRYGYMRLGYDPLPADAMDRPLGEWRGEEE